LQQIITRTPERKRFLALQAGLHFLGFFEVHGDMAACFGGAFSRRRSWHLEKLVDHVQHLGVALDHRRNISASELVAIERNQRG